MLNYGIPKNSATEWDADEECKRVISSKFTSNRSRRCYERQINQAQFRTETGQGAPPLRYLEAAADHAVDCIIASAADAHHLYPRRLHRRERAPHGRVAGPPVVPPPASWLCRAREADERRGGRGGGSGGRGHGHSLPPMSLAKCGDGGGGRGSGLG